MRNEWLDLLRKFEQEEVADASQNVAAEDTQKDSDVARELFVRSIPTRVSTPDVPEEVTRLTADDAEGADVASRVVAFHATIPQQGPIWPPKLSNIPETDTPGHCSLCGDALPIDPPPKFPRCRPCVQALWLALHETREGV